LSECAVLSLQHFDGVHHAVRVERRLDPAQRGGIHGPASMLRFSTLHRARLMSGIVPAKIAANFTLAELGSDSHRAAG
jgi:hypothetical protein